MTNMRPPDIDRTFAGSIPYCQGSPLRSEIEAHGPSSLVGATETAAAAIASRFGSGAVDGKIQAHIIIIER